MKASELDAVEVVRTLARNEIRQETRKLHVNMQNMLRDISYKIQCEVLDVQMAFSKSFVQVENNINRFKQELFAEDSGRSTEMLMHQNDKLKREVMSLREKISDVVGD